ncbi:uncharacterized protein [Primulina huaijiensis]|uniref:uncharacterized protein n=1 Tax=Primulina huaijiensis TaxID=1492673 RepID=UPI003CC73E04
MAQLPNKLRVGRDNKSWHVGNGAQINLFGNRWIPKSKGIISQPPTLDNRKVSDLIDEGRWKVSLVQQLFSPHLVHDILAIPLPVTPHEDFRFWLFDAKGKYTVREGYKAASGFYDSPMSSSSIKMKSWWKFLWALSLPPKVKIFCWRVIHNIIPTESNLQNHHVPVADVCPLCKASWDSTGHALFVCDAIKSCWKESRFRPLLKQVRHLEVFDILLWMKDKLSKKEFEVFAMRPFATWSERLRLIHKNQGRLEITNTDWSETQLNDFQLAQDAISIWPVDVQCSSPAV